jgi:hypothetical protein
VIWQLLSFMPLYAMIVLAFWTRERSSRHAREIKDLRAEVDKLGHECRELSRQLGHEVPAQREEVVVRDSQFDDVSMAPLPAARIVRNMLKAARN